MKNLILGGRSVIMGRGALTQLEQVEADRVFIVTGGQSMLKNGVIARIEQLLQRKGCTTKVFSGIKPNPDTSVICQGLDEMKDFKPDLLIAVGGGSPIDAAKVIALLYENKEIDFTNILSLTLPQSRKNLKFYAIPSTSGTGSEVTRAAVVTFKDTNLKIGLKTPAFIPDIAILDAELTMSMPGHVVAETGMDAVTHAVECYTNPNLDDFTECLARGAIEGLFTYLPLSYEQGAIDSREKVHHYQCIAGLAFDNVGLGMAHGIAHAIGGMFDLGHGLINAIALPYVLAYNSRDHIVKRKLTRLGECISQHNFIAAVQQLNKQLNIPLSLQAVGLSAQQFETNFSQLVANSLKGSTRVNAVKVSEQDMGSILRCLYTGDDVNKVAAL